MPVPPALTKTRTSGQTIIAADDHTDFSALRDTLVTYAVLTDTARTITVTHTWSASQTFASGWSAGAACTITAGGLTSTALSVSDQTALTFSHATARIVPGATSLSWRNNANSADNLIITDAGAATVRAGLTVTTGGLTVTTGGLTVSDGGITVTGNSTITGTLSGVTSLSLTTLTANTIVGGAATTDLRIGSTSLRLRNSADTLSVCTITPTAVTWASDVAMNWGGGTGVGQFAQTGASIAIVSAANGNLTLTAGGGGTTGDVAITSSASGGNVLLGGTGLSTAATANFARAPTISGTPTGNVAAGIFAFDATGNKWWVSYGGGTWKSTTLA
jgi:hypothetical protein